MLREHWLRGRKTPSFTLQWHLTNACELRCAHCYDRSSRGALGLDAAERVLETFVAFCREHKVRGQVCLTGGNPFLYPHFFPLYEALSTAQFPISILGNPVPEAALARVVALQKPVYYQVSLEGLRECNDRIRGEGHFARVQAFLALLRTHGVKSHVMLTVHRENLSQVVPLAEHLRGLADHFSFNRLSQVGGGAALELPSREEYAALLKDYLFASHTLPGLRFKDGLFNILRLHHRRPLWGGCTGFGCGAAFNFVAVLPDGEVHACRKFPSPIGHLSTSTLSEVYASAEAKRYRRGPRACSACPLQSRCGGCMAVSHGAGLRVLEDRDPHCFLEDRERLLADCSADPLPSSRA